VSQLLEAIIIMFDRRTFFRAGEGGRGEMGTLLAVIVKLCGEPRNERVVSPNTFVTEEDAAVVLKVSLRSRPESSSEAGVRRGLLEISTTPCLGRAGRPSIL